MRISRLKPFFSYVNSVTRVDVRPSVAYTSKSYHTRELGDVRRFEQNGIRMMGLSSTRYSQYSRGSHFGACFSNRLLSNSGFGGSLSFAGSSPLINHRLFSSASEAKGDIPRGTDVIADAGASGSNGGVGGDDWIEKIKEMWQSAVEVVKYTGEKAKEASNEATPHVQQFLDTHPYLRDVIVPVGGTLAGTLLAWSLLPRLFRRFHKYSIEGPGALLAGSMLWGPVPYEKSFWGALEPPVRYFITFMAFLEIGEMVAPTTIASQYVAQAWKGAFVISLLWFLHRWKTNVITRVLATKSIEGVQRDKLLTLDKISSVGLIVVGSMALAEACGVAVQSILTVGGIGGVATAFASKDILGNVLSGLSVQISQPFSIGDTIKVIVNKSRASFRSIVKRIPLQIDDIDKISQISEDIKSMLRTNSNVFLEKEAPYCFLSQIERSYAELTLGCNLKYMNKDAEQDILLEAVRIIKQHGAMLGSTQEDTIK
ncbi:hypothetical protein BUALT_Bualt01G0231900 [Buddleja alternifolia]|uniref:Uncharacterized protein n=1 Tax=Buddleja alternifolia TaxID=168488 RepID=A0AAV6YJX4_9LAMI|nr:hypothetical protein BUALT_Bualt01G0231900 [Buddleja alternifolia]